MNKAVFLDRDGVINVDMDYVYRVKDLRLISGVKKSLLELKKKGYALIIITNQSGIGRGYYSEKQYFELRDALHKRLKKQGIIIGGEYFCPHTPEELCNCRKPEIFLIKKAAKEHKIDLKKSYFIGDKTSDILAGKNAGLTTILVKTGKAGKDSLYNVIPDFICKNLLEAAEIIS